MIYANISCTSLSIHQSPDIRVAAKCTIRSDVTITVQTWQNEVCTIVVQYSSCARNGSQYRQKWPLQLFTSFGSLAFVAIKILGSLPDTLQCNHYALIFNDQFFKWAQAIPMFKKKPTHKANLFLNHWRVSFGILTYLFSDDSPQFVSMCFASNWGFFGLKHFTTSLFHLQTNWQL